METQYKKKETITKKILYIFGILLLISFIYFVSAIQEISIVTLNTSYGYNTTLENLTAYVDTFNSSQRYIYDWRVEGESFALLNLPFDYGTTNSSAIDFTSYNNTVWLGGDSAPYFPIYNSTFGAIGGSIYFQDTTGDERVSLNAESSVPLSTLANEVTVMMWINIETFQHTYVYQEWNTDSEKWQFGFLSNGTFLLFDDTDNRDYLFTGNFTFTNDTWYHIAVVGNERNWKGYVDGNLVLDEDSADGIMDMTHTARHYFGARRYNDDYTYELMGYMDEIMIFNRSLSQNQIRALYNKRNDLIIYKETYVGENWSIQATPIYDDEKGISVLSDNLTILDVPIIISLVLNTTSSNNYSTEDLNGWANVFPSEEDGTKIIYYWNKFGISNRSLIMPFEYGSNNTFTNDYAYNDPDLLRGVVNDNVTYNATGGFDGKGAYEFEGINGGITNAGFWDGRVGLKDDMTFMVWGKYNNLTGDMNLVTYAGPSESSDDNYLYQLELQSNKKLTYMHEYIAGSNQAFTSTVAADVDSNEWHHYAFVRDNSANTIKFYVDGVQLGDTGTYTNDPGQGENSLFYLGRDVEGEYWNGTLDDVYIYNKVFTEGEIEKYYLNQTNILDKTMTSIDDNWTICGIPINNEFRVGDTVCSNVLTVKEGPLVIENISVTDDIFIGENVTFNVSIYNETVIDSVWIKIWESVIKGAVKFIGYLENIIDDVWTIIVPTNSSFNESEYNYTIYANTTSGLESNESGSFNISETIIDSVILNSTLGTNLTTENLTAYVINLSSGYKTIYDWRKDGSSIAILNMPFDGGLLAENKTKVKDYSSFANNGTVSGAVYNSTGGRNSTGAYEFNGVNDSIEIDYNQDFNFTDGEGFTVMTWMSPNDLVNNRGDIISHYRGAVNYRIWDLQIYNGQARFAGCYNGTLDSCVYAYSGVNVNESNTWYHLAGTWNGTHLQVYVNGIAEDNTPPALENIHSTDNRGIRLGTDTATEWYNGTIDNVLIFNKSLSAQQILALYNNRTDLIVSNETSIGENWSVHVTPNDGTEDESSVMSNNLIIRAEDTCTCPSSPATWDVNMQDNCWLNSMCNISGYDLTFYSSGNFTINSTLYVNEIKNLSNGMIVWMKPNGMIYNG